MATLRLLSAIVALLGGSLACAGAAQAPRDAPVPGREGTIGLLYTGSGGVPEITADEGAAKPTCAPLPRAPEIDAGTSYAATFEAATAVLASARVDPIMPPEVTAKGQRLLWVKTCLREWTAWRRAAMDRAEALLGSAFTRASTPAERGATLLASAEGWTALGESFVRASEAAEPDEWKEKGEVHRAYAEGVRMTAKPLSAGKARESLKRCAEASSATEQQRARCHGIDRRLRELFGE